METVIFLGKTLLVIFAVSVIALPLYIERHNYGYIWEVWRNFTFRMLLQCLGVLAAVVVVGLALIHYVPLMEYGWLHLFYEHGGNAGIAPLADASKSDYRMVRLLAPLSMLAFLFAVPFLAHNEEKMFRKGHTTWRKIIPQSVIFGLIHCIVGVPLGFGFALALSGLFYGYHYKRTYEELRFTIGHEMAEERAVFVSTVYHSMYNTILVVVLITFLTIIVFA